MALFFKNRWHRNYFIRRYMYGPSLAAAARSLYATRFLIPASFYSLKRPIFVIGVSRSGTTVFTDYFRHHKDLCNWSEAAQIMERDFYNPSIDTLKTGPATGLDAFRIRFLFGAKTRLTGKSHFINKHPENSLRIRWIKQIFPDAVFVHMIRNGWPTVVSNYLRTFEDPFRTQWPFGQFPKPPKWREYMSLPLEAQFAHQWVDTIEYIRQEASSFLRPEDYTEIRYETFCRRPYEVLRDLDSFCGLPCHRRVYAKIPDRFENHNPRWNETLKQDQVERIAGIIIPLNRALGYNGWQTDVRTEAEGTSLRVKS